MDLNVYSYPNQKGFTNMTQYMTQKSTNDILNDSRLSNAAYRKTIFMAELIHEIEKQNQPNVKIIF